MINSLAHLKKHSHSLLAAALVAFLSISPVLAQTSSGLGPAPAAGTKPEPASPVGCKFLSSPFVLSNGDTASLTCNADGSLRIGPLPGALTGQVTVSCGTTSTALLAANAASSFIEIKVPSGGSNTVWFNFMGAAATAASPNLDLAAGGSQTFSAATFLPTQAFTCISSPAAQSVTLIYK